MCSKLNFQCLNCGVGLNANADKAGRSYGCPNCEALVIVPTQGALVPVAQPAVLPEMTPDVQRPRKLARRQKQREDDTKPVELQLGQLAGMKVDVDKKTRNAMATTFLGGLLVALGAILVAMFTKNSKSA